MLANKSIKEPLVKIHFSGGLGNQLFQYAFLSYLNSSGVQAQPEFGCLPVRLDSSGRPWIESIAKFDTSMGRTNILKSFVFRRIINMNSFIGTINKVSKHKFLNLRKPITNTPFVTIVNELGAVAEINNMIKRNVFGYFQTTEWMDKGKIQGRINFPNPNFDLMNLSELEKPLIVHVRLGDYANNFDLGILPKTYYLQAIQRSFDNFDHGSIWLFSDSPSGALDFIPEKFKHLVRILESHGDTPPDTLNKMRYGYGYVLANSSLSWWAAFLSTRDNPHVIAPSPWFRKLDEPRKLFPNDWKIERIDWRD